MADNGKRETNSVSNIFDAFYTRFVLRDFFGKIIPGSIFLICVFSTIKSWNYIFCFLKQSSILIISIGIGYAWISGICIQSFGEFIGLIKYPKSEIKEEERYQLRIKFYKVSTEYEKQEVERLVVIKEACGIGATSILLSFVFWILVNIPKYFSNYAGLFIPEDVLKKILLILSVIFFSFFLYRMHKKHRDRQYKYIKKVIEDRKALPEEKKD